MADERRLEQVSAALDGEGRLPEDLTTDEAAFRDAALGLRADLAATEPTEVPDVTAAVLRRVTRSGRRRRAGWLPAAAVFVVAALGAAIALRPGGPAAPELAAAEVADQVIGAQQGVATFDARVVLVERGVHPDVPERRLEGTLRYDAPETLWLDLDERGPRPAGWPANDVEVVIDAGVAWSTGLGDCPVGSQPGCLRPTTDAVTGLAPFAGSWVSPLDLIVPTDAFLPAGTTDARRDGDRVVVETTVARVDRLVEGLRSAGAIRSVHPTDRATLELDATSLTLRRLTITAGDDLARSTWSATRGYRDTPGDVVLELSIDPADLPPARPPAAPEDADTTGAGFTDTPLPVDWALPAGFSVHRTGLLDSGGPATDVIALSDGRAWIRVDATEEWDRPGPFGPLGPLVRQIPVGDGVGYTDTAGTAVAIHTAERDIVVTGSVDRGQLIDVAAAVATGEPLDPAWDHSTPVPDLPDGALVPDADHLATVTEGTVVIGIPGPGRTGVTLTQQPATALPPPPRADIAETRVRGRAARYSPQLGTLTWLEDGWMRELSGPGLDLAALQAVAEDLVNR